MEKDGTKMNNARTIMMHFPDVEHASSLKIIQEPTSQIRAFYFKKSLLAKVESLEYANNYAVYFLITDEENPSIYVGQSVHGITRLKEHLKQKDFWQYGILFVTDNSSFDKQLIDYLEYEFIQLFSESSYLVENRDMRIRKPNINWYMNASINSFVSQIRFFLEALGVTVHKKELTEDKQLSERTYYVAEKNHPAKIYIHDGQYVLTKGSIILNPNEKLKTYQDRGALYKRLTTRVYQLLKSEQAVQNDEYSIRLTEDVVCSSASNAAELCSGKSQSGLNYWQGLRADREKLM